MRAGLLAAFLVFCCGQSQARILTDMVDVEIVEGELPAGFASLYAARDLPVLLKNTPALEWNAMTWTPEAVVDMLSHATSTGKAQGGGSRGVLRHVKHTRHENGTFYICHESPLKTFPQLVSAYQSKCFTTHDMDPPQFLHLFHLPVQEGGAGGYFAYSSTLPSLGSEFVAAVQPLQPLMVSDLEYHLSPDEIRQTTIWMSPAGGKTQTHFDLSHNYFVQLYGHKEFVLFPPSAATPLAIYPALHPGHQASRLELKVDRSSGKAVYSIEDSISKEPCLAVETCQSREEDHSENSTILRGWKAELGPGDVLYIPPLWFHHVTALQPSISVSVWTHSKVSRGFEALWDSFALPIRSQWSPPMKFLALRLFLVSVVAQSLQVDVITAKRWIRVHMLETRFRDIRLIGDNSRMQYCATALHEQLRQAELAELALVGVEDSESGEEDEGALIVSAKVRETRLEKQSTEAVTHCKVIFHQIASNGTQARMEIFLGNFVELSVHAVVGAPHMRLFLQAITDC